MGTPLSPGSEILVTDTEYRAIVNVAKYRAEKDGLKLRALHLPGTAQEMKDLTEDSLVEMIVRELRPETRMLIVSHVMTGSGLALPLAKIARETRARSICLVVDGAHGTGALPLNMSELGDLDYYAGMSDAYRLMCIQRGEEAARAALPKIREAMRASAARLAKP